MTGRTTQAGKKPLSILRQRRAAGGFGQPLSVVLGSKHHNIANHLRVIRSAVLRAEQVIGARRCSLKPYSGIAAGNRLPLHAEGGNGETVKNILRNQGYLNRLAHRYMQRVDLMLASRMFYLPHPLLDRKSTRLNSSHLGI